MSGKIFIYLNLLLTEKDQIGKKLSMIGLTNINFINIQNLLLLLDIILKYVSITLKFLRKIFENEK